MPMADEEEEKVKKGRAIYTRTHPYAFLFNLQGDTN